MIAPLARWFLECANNAYRMWSYGSEWTGYDEWVEFLRHVCGYERDGRVDYTSWNPWYQATMHGGVRVMHEKFCIVADRPESLHIETVDGRGRLHRVDGPAKRYRDGWSIYSIHGARIANPDFIEDHSKLTVARIQSEQNAEVRRAMVGMYGREKYLRDAGAIVAHADKYGKLFRLPQDGDEDLVMVEVVNSTPEPLGYEPTPDENVVRRGTRVFKIYTLRVPPTTQTAHAGIAWTFGMTAEQYAPVVET